MMIPQNLSQNHEKCKIIINLEKETFLAKNKALQVQVQKKMGGENPFYKFLGSKWHLMGCFKPQPHALSIEDCGD